MMTVFSSKVLSPFRKRVFLHSQLQSQRDYSACRTGKENVSLHKSSVAKGVLHVRSLADIAAHSL